MCKGGATPIESDSLLPPEPKGSCSKKLQEKVAKMYKKKMETGLNINENIQRKKEFRNPRCDNSKDYLKKSMKVIVFCHVTLLLSCFSIYEKLIEFVEIDEKGTNYPPVSKKI